MSIQKRRNDEASSDDINNHWMSFKQFIKYIDDHHLSLVGSEERYRSYELQVITFQKLAFFRAHCKEKWLRDMYHPANLLEIVERRNEHAHQVARKFLLCLQSGKLDLNPSICAKQRAIEIGRIVEESTSSAVARSHCISFEPRLIELIIEQTYALMVKLDFEKGIKENILGSIDFGTMEYDSSRGESTGPIQNVLTSLKELEDIELLNVLLHYLYYVHGLDYQGMIEAKGGKSFQDLRNERISNVESIEAGADREMKLLNFWKERLAGMDPFEQNIGKAELDAEISEVLEKHIQEIKNERNECAYSCPAWNCRKLFSSPHYVHKHLKLRHHDLFVELTTIRFDGLYFKKYLWDLDAPGGTPMMQQHWYKPAEHKLSLDTSMGDHFSNKGNDNRNLGGLSLQNGERVPSAAPELSLGLQSIQSYKDSDSPEEQE